MKNRAVIYVRTSSEHQGEKSSPVEQEADCRKLAEDQGLTVVNVYRDIERYRAKTKLVDPSGTRSDRPALLAMLRDASQGHFEVILAWREDRLYRGMRAMLMVLETIQEHKIAVVLARETFDPKMAPLKAWVAQMELDGMKERMTMGVKARLRAGKANSGHDRYGYKRNGEIIEVVEEEARWVQQIFEWYLGKMKIQEIRRRLIAANAPQKGSTVPRRYQWARSSIQAILQSAKTYATGIKIQRRAGEAFEIPVTPIIDLGTYDAYLKRRQANKKHPAHHQKRDYLIGGLLYCECNFKWRAHTRATKKNRHGTWVERKTPIGVYYCAQLHEGHISPNCPRSIGTKKADDYVWEKVCRAINDPEILIAKACNMVDELRNNAEILYDDRDRVQKQLDALILERQWVITQARKGVIDDSDMEYQLGTITLQELSLRRDLVSIGNSIDMNALDDWDGQVREYFADLQAGLQSLNTASQNDEERQEIFNLKRDIVLALVQKVTINRNRDLSVHFKLDILRILQEQAKKHSAGGGGIISSQIGMDETYSRIQLILVHPHRSSSCG